MPFQVAAIHPLIADLEPLSNLLQEYKDDSVYTTKINKLCETYKSMRRVRPDGNCFFRGFGFSFFERLLNEPEEWQKFQVLSKESRDQLLALGFPKFTLEDFHDSVTINTFHLVVLWQLSRTVHGCCQSPWRRNKNDTWRTSGLVQWFSSMIACSTC